jgi:hypothetical protein
MHWSGGGEVRDGGAGARRAPRCPCAAGRRACRGGRCGRSPARREAGALGWAQHAAGALVGRLPGSCPGCWARSGRLPAGQGRLPAGRLRGRSWEAGAEQCMQLGGPVTKMIGRGLHPRIAKARHRPRRRRAPDRERAGPAGQQAKRAQCAYVDADADLVLGAGRGPAHHHPPGDRRPQLGAALAGHARIGAELQHGGGHGDRARELGGGSCG